MFKKFVTACVFFVALTSLSAFAVDKVNINTANQSQLESLTGIGASTASAIIDYREQNGPFTSIEQLVKVKGIADKKVQLLADYVTTSE